MREDTFFDRPKATKSNRIIVSQRLKIVTRRVGSKINWFILEPFGGTEVERGTAATKTAALKRAAERKRDLQKENR